MSVVLVCELAQVKQQTIINLKNDIIRNKKANKSYLFQIEILKDEIIQLETEHQK